MHDGMGRELKVGDIIVIPAVVKSVSTGPDYCNVSVETIGGRRPDGQKNHYGDINTGQLYRANEGDDTAIVTKTPDGKTFLA